MIVTSANPWTLCGLESPIAAVGFTGRLLVEQYNLSVPQAGYHLRSASLIAIHPSRQTVPSGLVEDDFGKVPSLWVPQSPVHPRRHIYTS